MSWEKQTRLRFVVIGMDSCAPGLMPIQGYFSDDEMKSCLRCERRFVNRDEVRVGSYPTMSFGWYEQRLEHTACPGEAKA